MNHDLFTMLTDSITVASHTGHLISSHLTDVRIKWH